MGAEKLTLQHLTSIRSGDQDIGTDSTMRSAAPFTLPQSLMPKISKLVEDDSSDEHVSIENLSSPGSDNGKLSAATSSVPKKNLKDDKMAVKAGGFFMNSLLNNNVMARPTVSSTQVQRGRRMAESSSSTSSEE